MCGGIITSQISLFPRGKSVSLINIEYPTILGGNMNE